MLKDKTLAAKSIFASRSIPTDIDNLPVVLIYVKNETSEIFDESPRRYRRVATVILECITKGKDEDDADKLAEQLVDEVEAVLGEDETLENLVNDSFISGINFQTESDAQSPIGAAVISFECEYYQEPNIKGADTDFLSMEVDWQVGHHDASSNAVIDASSEFDIPQE